MKAFSIFILSFICLVSVHAQNDLPEVVSGTIERTENFNSAYVTGRNVDVWLPEGYSDAKKYDVLYMHDGQMLYDPKKGWNKQAWNVDDVVTDLIKNNITKDFIVVGVWNGGATRHPDYFPQQPFENLSQVEKDTIAHQLQRTGRSKEFFKPTSDGYLKFLVEELKPFIDKKYSVYTDPEHTFIAGSSMGGLISFYALCEYPEIFGGAACLSTHWVGTFTLENNPIPDAFINYLKEHLPAANTRKLYFDCGDQTLDALYPEIQKRVDALMTEKGYDQDHWITRYFPGENHSENAWNKRLHIPITFLLKK